MNKAEVRKIFKKLIMLIFGIYAFFYLSQIDNLPTLKLIQNYVNLNQSQTSELTAQKEDLSSQPAAPKQTEHQTISKPKAASIPTVAKKKNQPAQIQTYQVTVENGKVAVSGKPTPYGQFYNAEGIILYIQEVRANKRVTIRVPFRNGRVDYKYPLTYTVGDVVVNLDEYFKGKADDPNTVLGYAQYHLTDGNPYLQPSYMVQSNNPVIMKLARNITMGKRNNTEKSRAIFAWVAKHIAYNAPLVNAAYPPVYSALQTYKTRVVLCTGYADLSAALHRAVGIEAKISYGENHAWNEIKLNGVWKTEDPTYGSGFINANTMTFVPSYHPAYFYKTDKHKEGEYPW